MQFLRSPPLRPSRIFWRGATDLECALRLAATYFYKQAAQVLRAFLEGQVFDLKLALDEESFSNRKKGNYRVPNLRGRDGLLSNLERQGSLEPILRSRIDFAYEDLNASVHGAERTLIHSEILLTFMRVIHFVATSSNNGRVNSRTSLISACT